MINNWNVVNKKVCYLFLMHFLQFSHDTIPTKIRQNLVYNLYDIICPYCDNQFAWREENKFQSNEWNESTLIFLGFYH